MVNNVKCLLSVLFCVCISATFLQAQVAGVDISVSPKTGTPDTYFEILVTVDPAVVGSQPELAESENFSLLGTATRTQTFISNGSATTQYAYSFTLLPQRTGTLQLPEVLLTHNSRLLSLKTDSVIVTQSKTQPHTLQNDKILFQQSVNKLTAYQGEQIRNTFTILSEEPFRDVEFPAPAFPGFWVEAQERDTSGSRMQGNKRVFFYETARALYPLSPGTVPLAPKTITLKVRDPENKSTRVLPNGFPFTFMETRAPKRITIASNPLEIEVKPLPPAPADAVFWDAPVLVGETLMRVQFDHSPIDIESSKTLHVTIESTGNINPIKKLPLSSKSNYRIYQEAPQTGFMMDGSLQKMQLKLSASIVPRKTGTISIEPLTLTYFDPGEKRYKAIRSQPLSFQVTGEMPQDTEHDSDATPTPIDTPVTLGAEPTVPRYQPTTLLEKTLERISPGLLLFLITLLTVSTVVFWLFIPIIRSRRYLKKLKQRIQQANTTTELINAFESHIKKMTGISAGAFKKSELANELSHYIENKSLLFAVQSFLDSIEQSAFNPSAETTLDTIRSEALTIIEAWH